MNTYQLFLFLVITFSVTLSESCPDGWIDSLELGCLYFGLGLESSTWLGASFNCEELHPNSSTTTTTTTSAGKDKWNNVPCHYFIKIWLWTNLQMIYNFRKRTAAGGGFVSKYIGSCGAVQPGDNVFMCCEYNSWPTEICSHWRW